MSHILIPADHYLFLASEGDMTLAEMTTAWREVQDLLAETGWERLFVDVTALRNCPNTEELFDLAKLIWRDFPQGGRMALLVRWDQSRFAKLLETLVRSVGLYLTVFVSEEQAEAWILADPQDKNRLLTFNPASETSHASSRPDEVNAIC